MVKYVPVPDDYEEAAEAYRLARRDAVDQLRDSRDPVVQEALASGYAIREIESIIRAQLGERYQYCRACYEIERWSETFRGPTGAS